MEAQSRCQHVCSRALSASAKTNGKPTSHPSSRPPPHPRATAISTKASGVWGRSRSSLHVPHHTMPLCSRGHRSCRASPNPLYAGICRWPAMQHDPRRLRAPAEPRLFPKRQLRTLLFERVSRIFCEHHGRQLYQVVVVADFFDAGRAWSHTRVWPVSNVE
jgi:hypothetical protein